MTSISEGTMLNWDSLQETLPASKKRAMRALLAEYTLLLKEPPEGFVVKVEDPFIWDVGIYGPPATPYWGGYFKLQVTFPDDYPFEPPKLKFRGRFWHPNVYHNGSVCMSILHDPQTEDIPNDLPREEKWNPTLSVRTVLLSLISILGAPNPDSPANPEASKMYRSWVEDGDQDYVKAIEDTVKRSKKTAIREGVNVPKTLEEYLSKPEPKITEPLVDYSSLSEGEDSDSDLISLPSSEGSGTFSDAEFSAEPSNMDQGDYEQLPNPSSFTPTSEVTKSSNLSSIQSSHAQTASCADDISYTSNRGDIAVTYRDDRNASDPPMTSSNESTESNRHKEISRIPQISSDAEVDSAATSNQNGSSHLVLSNSVTDTLSAAQFPNCNRKRRRPPRIYIFANQGDIKKRRKL